MTPIIIISDDYIKALDWANAGRLPKLSYIIILNAQDCEKLAGIELKMPFHLAWIGYKPIDADYIANYIRSRIR